MINCDLGHLVADKEDLVSFFYAMLTNDEFNSELQMNAILGLKNCALTNSGQWKCRELENLPKVLLEKCYTENNKMLQFNAFEVIS